MIKRLLALLAVAALCAPLASCIAANLIGGMAQNMEYQKKIEVLAKYDGLAGKRVAVLVDTDLGTRYEHPNVVVSIARGVGQRLATSVPDITVLHPDLVVAWQHRMPDWYTMPYGDMAAELNVDRIVYVDVFEYRLHPPGNRFEWDGVCAANVSVIERDGFDPDTFADTFNISSQFPDQSGVIVDDAGPLQIETLLLNKFVQQVAWLFHDHEEPKYPDKYRPSSS